MYLLSFSLQSKKDNYICKYKSTNQCSLIGRNEAMRQIKTKDELIAFLRSEYDKNPEAIGRVCYMTESTECSISIQKIPDFIENRAKGFPTNLQTRESRLPIVNGKLKVSYIAFEYTTIEAWQEVYDMTQSNLQQAQKDECQWMVDIFNNDLYQLGTREQAETAIKAYKEQHEQAIKEMQLLEQAHNIGIIIDGTDVSYNDRKVSFEYEKDAQIYALNLLSFVRGEADGISVFNDYKYNLGFAQERIAKYLRKDGTQRCGLSHRANQRYRDLNGAIETIQERISLFVKRQKAA
jgi:hypothetical protein